MTAIRKSRCIILFLVVFPGIVVYSEGTKQVIPLVTNAKGQLCINKARNDFAFYDASQEFRLNFTVSKTSEAVRFGFGQVLGSYTTDLVYRIKDPSGNTVYGPFPVPSSGSGYINTYAEAIAGPFAGGYNYLEYKPLTTGDFYLEFFYPATPSGIYDENNRHLITYFDISVIDAAGIAKNGRVWSKAWQFWSGDPTSTTEKYYGKMMILSDDSIVTQVDCNGYMGGTFSFSSNITGCATTGNIVNDRMSRPGFHTYPQYKVFLNDPDSLVFPTQKITSAIVLPIIVTTNCVTGGAEFGIKVVKDGAIKLVIEINPLPGADAEDVQIIANVKANPGGNGYNILTWDGNDNFGKAVPNGTTLSYTIANLSGMTHLPIHDIENNYDGYIVSQVRPKGGQMRIYWDDSQIPGGTSNTTSGCINPGGCHTWSNDFGNNNTINSWWFVSWSEIPGTVFISKKIPVLPVITGSGNHCKGIGNESYTVSADPNSTSYVWSYSGTGLSITTSGNTALLNFRADATAGQLSVTGHNITCGDGPTTSININIEPLPVVSLADYPDMCFTEPGFALTGGQPTGGTYYVNGTLADSLYPYLEPAGLHTIIYDYTSASGCNNSDTASLILKDDPGCKGNIFFPNVFSPNGDSKNDLFRPVIHNVYDVSILIYNRWGQLIFSSENAAAGWDGTLNGKECPTGEYSYKSTFRPSLRDDEISTVRGMVLLLR